jgi:hypothetical protein
MPATFELPRLRHVVRHAMPRVVEATLIPLALFYLAMWMLGMWGALAATLLWSYTAVARRLVRRKPVPAVLVMGAAAMTVRTAIALASGSVFMYFLQPTLGTLTVGAAFLISVPAGKPLAQRLVADFCPIPDALAHHPRVRAFFTRITLLWAFVQMANAAITVWLLTSQSVSVYLMAKTLVSWTLTLGTIATCSVWFLRSMRQHGILAARVR